METILAVIALIVGFSAGWLLRDRRARQNASADEHASGLAFKLQQRDEELRAARAEVAVHTSTLDTLRNDYAALSKKYEALASDGKASKKGSTAKSKKGARPATKRKTQARTGRR